MAKVDISWARPGVTQPEDPVEANYEPTPRPPGLGSDSIRMRTAVGPLNPDHRGVQPARWSHRSPVKILAVFACLFGYAPPSLAQVATIPDPPPRRSPPRVGSAGFAPTSSLDGLYLWLGPSGAASHVADDWDSTIGVDAAVVRVEENARLGVIGGSLGASRWTERGGGRVWLDAIVGTRVLGWMIGVSAGPILELSELAHPRLGASFGVWAFAGITPFARIGTVSELGTFGEIGIHLALPIWRR
jgi:hypothetical protein